MIIPGFIRKQPDGVMLSVKLQPRASRNEVGEVVGNELRIRVTAPPVDAAANEALVRLLAERIGCAKSALELVRGQTSRHKVLKLYGVSAETVAERLLTKK